MNTKYIMVGSAIFLGVIGIAFTFLPAEILQVLKLPAGSTLVILMQLLGALYFGFAILDWMSKDSIIGGIYNRPIAIANFTHYLVGALALIKSLFSNTGFPTLIWVLSGLYALFAILFGLITFGHPANRSSKST